MARQILTYLEQHRTEMLADLETLVRLESPSTDKGAVDAESRVLAGLLAGLGAKVTVIPQSVRGNHLRAEWEADGGPGGQTLVLGHLDTVFAVGELERNPFRREGEFVYGPGVSDMKGGLVSLLWAMRALKALGRRPRRRVVFLATSDEEVGSETARPYIEAEARKSAATLVVEPATPDGAIKGWRKGSGQFIVTVTGRSAHSGADPGAGISAVVEMAHQILRLDSLNAPAEGATLNVGVVAGGTRPNVVPEQATAEVEVRIASAEQGERFAKAIFGLTPVLPGAQIKVTGGIDTPSLEPRHSEPLIPLVRQVYGELGLELKVAGSGGVSDGNLTAAAGCPTLDGLGPIGFGAHTSGEHLLAASLWERAAILARLLELV